MNTPRREYALYAALHLLDRQIVDPDGRMAGKVDDLEVDVPAEPGGDLPVVTALLSGGGALARRIDGRLGAWIAALGARLAREADPARIPFDVVRGVGAQVDVAVSHRDLETFRAERWTRETIVDHIPGAGHAPE
jgi:sporulation protein YlmC with PRC-barrel domain